MKRPSRQRSIASMLTWMNVLTSGIALLLAYASFLAYNLFAFRQAAVESLSGEAQVVGANSVSAIVFDDRPTAEKTLSALSSSPDIVGAVIYTPAEVPFAQYSGHGIVTIEPRHLPANQSLAHWTNGVDILVAARIEFQGQQVGTVYVQAHLHGLIQQALRFAAIAAGILLLCLGAAVMVGSAFRRILAQPVVSFAQTARLVSRYRDYSLRFAPDRTYSELASLTEAFNEMLSEIQGRDKDLEQAKADLEHRVEERTVQLQSANRELEAYSYTVAHDLRGPLQAMANVCFLLRAMTPEEPAGERSVLIGRLGSSVAAMSAMIDDLLDLSRSTSARLRFEQLDLSLMAASILDGLAEAEPGRKVEVLVHSGCRANADPGLMQVVLQNLLRNAWKFTTGRDPAHIEFGCTRQGKATVFYVRDNGAGFDPRLSDRLFKPFQRLHAASEFPGTGIGLATVQRIIRRHGGEVWAEGEVDKGATFYFTLDLSRL